VLAIGDDFGFIKLFKYPSLQKNACYTKFVGHSAQVTNLRFTHSSSHLISTGGSDKSIFQWAYKPQDAYHDFLSGLLPLEEEGKSEEKKENVLEEEKYVEKPDFE